MFGARKGRTGLGLWRGKEAIKPRNKSSRPSPPLAQPRPEASSPPARPSQLTSLLLSRPAGVVRRDSSQPIGGGGASSQPIGGGAARSVLSRRRRPLTARGEGKAGFRRHFGVKNALVSTGASSSGRLGPSLFWSLQSVPQGLPRRGKPRAFSSLQNQRPRPTPATTLSALRRAVAARRSPAAPQPALGAGFASTCWKKCVQLQRSSPRAQVRLHGPELGTPLVCAAVCLGLDLRPLT